MTRIRCRDRQCTFNKSGLCTADEIEYEPDAGCLTMEPREESDDDEREDWESEENEEWEEDDDWEEEDDWDEEEDEDDFELDEEETPRPASKKKSGRR